MTTSKSPSSPSSTPVENVIDKINKTSITSLVVGISKIPGLTGLSKTYTHVALLLLNINLENQSEPDSDIEGILVEYGPYNPNMCEIEINYIKQKLVTYHYGDKGGLRYYGKNLEQFKEKFGNRCYIEMDINSYNQKTFDAFINEVAPICDYNWIKSKYNALNHNCQYFAAEALKILKPVYSKFKVTNTVEINKSDIRTKHVPPVIMDVLKTLKD